MATAHIFLDEAMGSYENMPPDELAARWVRWKTSSTLAQSEYERLKTTVYAPIVIALDALASAIEIYTATVEAIAALEQTYITAKAAYDAALNSLTGGAGAAVDAAKLLVNEAVTAAKTAAITLYENAKEQAEAVVDIKVAAATILPD